MKKKIEQLEDIQLLVRNFYKKVLNDDLLAPYFSFARHHYWDRHLDLMDHFWNNIVFFEGGYYGNPLEVHQKIHHFQKMDAAHFQRWVALFHETVDASFKGEKAELAKQRASSIAQVMQIKIFSDDQSK